MSNEPIVPHVYVAINAVMDEVSRVGIAKDRNNQSQGYKFRGIDDVYNALAPILSKHHLIITPRGLARTCEERPTSKGGVIFYVNVTVEYDLISAKDGSKITAGPMYGEAMDSADKATNKAQSAAYKYMAMQQFCIPTEGDNDADTVTHDPAPKVPLWVTAAKAAIECLDDVAACDAWWKENVAMLKTQPQAERDDVIAKIKARKTALASFPGDDFSQTRRTELTAPKSTRTPINEVSPLGDDEIPY